MLEYKSLGWWYWLALAALLAAALAGVGRAFAAFLALSAVQLVHFAAIHRSVMAFPVQTRLAYLLIAVAALWPPLAVIYWLQLGGTALRVASGYCVIARTLSLLPWNLNEPLTARVVWRTFVSPPVRGSILQARTSVRAGTSPDQARAGALN